MKGKEGSNHVPLFETRKGKGRVVHRLFAVSVFVGICLIWAYRVIHIPSRNENGRWVWFGLLAAELWFGFYWILTQALRWNQVYRSTFKDRLSQRFDFFFLSFFFFFFFFYIYMILVSLFCVCERIFVELIQFSM
jgi:hypothetical protein